MKVTVQHDAVPPRVRIDGAVGAVTRTDMATGVTAQVRGSALPPPAPVAPGGSVGTLRDTDLYEAFPYAVRHPETGVSMAVWRSAAQHLADASGEIWMATSTDDWATWTAPVRIKQGLTATDDCGPAGLTWLPGGGWGLLVLRNESYRGMFTKSTNNGATWSTEVQISRQTVGGAHWAFPSHVTYVDNGTAQGILAATSYGGRAAVTADHAWTQVERSTDGGATWTHVAEVGDQSGSGPLHGEAQIQDLGDGHLLMLLRRETAASGESVSAIVQSESFDYGLTWSQPESAGLDGMSGQPAMVLTADGTVVVTLRVPELNTTGGWAWAFRPPLHAHFTVGPSWAARGRMAYGQFTRTAGDDLVLIHSVETATNTDANIVALRFVATGQSAPVLYDVELPQERAVTYTDSAGSTGIVALPDCGVWLVHPIHPERSVEVEAVTHDTERVASSVSVLDIPGGLPYVVAAGDRAGVSSTMVVRTRDEDERARLAEVLRDQCALWVSDHAGHGVGPRYVQVLDVDINRQMNWCGDQTREHTLPYLETGAPADMSRTGDPGMPTTWAGMPTTWSGMPQTWWGS